MTDKFKRHKILIIAGAAIAVIALSVPFLMESGAGDKEQLSAASTASGADQGIADSDPANLAGMDLDAPVRQRVLGDLDAPVTIIEYSSLTCPHCASFHEKVLPDLKEQYIDTGKAKLVMRDYPLDEVAQMASVVAHCAGDEHYFRFIDALFLNQSQWSRARDPQAALVQFAKLGGLSEEKTTECLASQEMADEVLKMRLEGQQTHQIRSTPTFIIGKQSIVGAESIEEFAKVIDAQLP